MTDAGPASVRGTRELFDLTGRRAVVTGGAGLLGRRFASALVDLGGGVLRTQVHHIDHLDWIFGPLERVYAAGGHRTDLEIDVEDSVTFLFRSAGGTPVQGHLDYRQRPKVVSLLVVGTEARVGWDHYGGRLVVTPTAAGAEPQVHSWPYDRDAMFTAQMRDVVRAVRAGSPLRTPLRDGVRAVRLVEAIEASMASDQAVTVAGT